MRCAQFNGMAHRHCRQRTAREIFPPRSPRPASSQTVPYPDAVTIAWVVGELELRYSLALDAENHLIYIRDAKDPSSRSWSSPFPHSFSLNPAAVESSAVNRKLSTFSLSQHRGPRQTTFKEYPPSQVSGSLSVTRFLEAIQSGAAGGGK
jgi:hypothetical protein